MVSVPLFAFYGLPPASAPHSHLIVTRSNPAWPLPSPPRGLWPTANSSIFSSGATSKSATNNRRRRPLGRSSAAAHHGRSSSFLRTSRPNSPPKACPIPFFYFSALVAWTYFSYALQNATNVVVENQRMITKVYFPRLVLPLSSVISGLVDSPSASSSFRRHALLWHQARSARRASFRSFSCSRLTALGVGLWLSALNALYRDVPLRHALLSVLDARFACRLFQLARSRALALVYGSIHGRRH